MDQEREVLVTAMERIKNRMNAIRTITVFTGTRADYGLLRPLLRELAAQPGVNVTLLVTGTHLAASSGATWREIVEDGVQIDECVEVLLNSDTATGIYTAMGLGMIRYGDAFKRLATDLLVLLGDRFEAFAAAAAATVSSIPIAHLHGGELTLGAMDESFRHAITKMSHLHFTSTEPYRQRVIQLGESPERVFNVGALGVENACAVEPYARDVVARQLQLAPAHAYLLVTFHPVTLCADTPDVQLAPLLCALDQFPDYAVVFTGANADAGGMRVNQLLREHVARQPERYRFFMSLGTTLYLSAAREAAVVVGNSSSAIIEIPSLGVPSVDIGTRQQGRVRSESVISCALDTETIIAALQRALTPAFRQQAVAARNPYAQPGTAKRITQLLLAWKPPATLSKPFYDVMPRRAD